MKFNLSNLWRWGGTIGRGEYFVWGVLLFAVKFNLDRLLSWAWFQTPLTLFDPEQARLYLWQSLPSKAAGPYLLTMLAISLPFLWAGVVLTLRRLRAMEGLICILMAAPLAFAVGSAGGAVGYFIQKTFWWPEDSTRLFCLALLAVPAMMAVEHALPPPLPLLEVKSSVVVDAPPDKVWKNVVTFSELAPPQEFIFRLGVAYPVRAEIYGKGVGAVRQCNFSTGPFVEPIQTWDEPRLLRFSVTKNPEPMQEWTPYRHVHPAHLDGYLESKGGQFRLVPLQDGRTLLEGTTWYRHRLWPARYWQVWSDFIIHRIHLRVLNHVKKLSEGCGE